MANKSDFKFGTTINGPVAYINPFHLNGQIVMDTGIMQTTMVAKLNLSGTTTLDNTKMLVSGTFGYLSEPNSNNEYQFNVITAASKGTDALYMLGAAKSFGEYKCYKASNPNVDYTYWNDGENVIVTALEEGMRFYIQAYGAISIGQELCPINEYQVAATAVGTAGYAKIFIAESSAVDGGICLVRVRRNGLSA